MATLSRTLPDLSKLEPLDGTNFKRWSQKLLIFFEQLDVDYVLFTNPPENPQLTSDTTTAIVSATQTETNRTNDDQKVKYERDNKTVRGHLLNHMSNTLFDLFVNQKSAKEIWETLETRYGGDDAGRKKYVVGKWLQFHMTDDKPIMDQVHEYENLQRQVPKQRKKIPKGGQQKTFKNNDGKIQKNKVTCYCCGKTGHKAYQCYQRKDQQKPNHKQHAQTTPQVNLAETEEVIAAVVVEANLVENKSDWILDTGASKHFCSNKELFQELKEAADGECVYMGNSATAGVLGKGKVLLKLTSGKTLALQDVLYVPSLRRNLISGSLLNKVGLKIVLEADKVIITKNGDFIGKGYLADGLFVLNTMPFVSNKSISNSAYIVESVNIWHGRLGHVNFDSVKRLKSMNLIDISEADKCSKCSVCVESKFVRKPFKPVTQRCTELLELIHSDLADFKNTLSKGFAPNLSYLKVWGCLAKVAYPDFRKSKYGPKTFDCVFIGYAQNSAAYRFMCLLDNSFCEARNAEFFELIFPFNKMHDSLAETSNNLDTSSSSITTIDEIRRSKRQRIERSFGPDFLTAFIVQDLDRINDHVVSAYLVEEDPKTYVEAITSIDSGFWKEAIKNELDSIMTNHTWDLVDLPIGSKPIKCKWIFKKKIKPDGSIDKFKARLVVVGYTQKEGIDYFDTYSPVTKIATIRTLVAISAINGLMIHQMDVKTAFLNGDLEEEIYMEQPEGFIVPGLERKVCKLRKSLYGLKQAPKQWYEKFDRSLLSNGYKTNASDTCVYTKLCGCDFVIICLYVDDMLIFGSNLQVINETKSFLNSQFDMKDLGEADVILGVKIRKTENGFSLCQSHYIEKILKKFGCHDEIPVRTPYDPSACLKKNKGDSVSQADYAKIIGSVMFLMNYTRPDIAYAVSRLSRYTHNPNKDHWDALRRLLRYLKGTMNLCLHFNKYPAVLEGFCDANWVTDNDEVSSTSGYVFTLGGGAISWKSAKQTCIARSTMESEFIALELAGQEAEWLRNLVGDVPLWGSSVPVSLHCDSQAAIGIAKNYAYNGKRRHIRIRHGAVKELLKGGIISLEYVRSERNLADPLTKGLTRRIILETSRAMGLKPLE
ncbi:UNVERIFIED_CONTAM: Retrovirus-related Pol polyprotein from transposon TNT 1-94 [Sesamum radiatum]|uniref:Retrovirus-related Pol polyprotein from transposon TNT 1-94 n=1 Tax=Sesamum radiatum TaxID=300843 RepID=A0AAW2IXW3_SESRA